MSHYEQIVKKLQDRSKQQGRLKEVIRNAWTLSRGGKVGQSELRVEAPNHHCASNADVEAHPQRPRDNEVPPTACTDLESVLPKGQADAHTPESTINSEIPQSAYNPSTPPPFSGGNVGQPELRVETPNHLRALNADVEAHPQHPRDNEVPPTACTDPEPVLPEGQADAHTPESTIKSELPQSAHDLSTRPPFAEGNLFQLKRRMDLLISIIIFRDKQISARLDCMRERVRYELNKSSSDDEFSQPSSDDQLNQPSSGDQLNQQSSKGYSPQVILEIETLLATEYMAYKAMLVKEIEFLVAKYLRTVIDSFSFTSDSTRQQYRNRVKTLFKNELAGLRCLMSGSISTAEKTSNRNYDSLQTGELILVLVWRQSLV
jgi:hypothetical protein